MSEVNDADILADLMQQRHGRGPGGRAMSDVRRCDPPTTHRYEYDKQQRRVCRRCGMVFWQDAASPPAADPLDWEALRIERGWPTPIAMRHAADGLDNLSIPRFGDILRYVADACDARLARVPEGEQR